jgi:hypothetical protein
MSLDSALPRRPKSCGPAKSGLLFSPPTGGEKYRGDDGDRATAIHRGEHEASRSTTACGTPDVSGATVATTLVCFFTLHTGLRMRWRIRHSARPQFEGKAMRGFGRPRAVTTTGATAHGCLKIEWGIRGDAPRLNTLRTSSPGLTR